MYDRLGGGLGDSLGLSIPMTYHQVVMELPLHLETEDIKLLQSLAAQVEEISKFPIEKEKKLLWVQHNDLKGERPLLFCDPENAWYEIIPQESLVCKSKLGRVWEFKLRKEIYWANSLRDDRVIEPYFDVHYIYKYNERGLKEKIIGGKEGGAYTWEAPIKKYKDMEQLCFSIVEVDHSKTDELKKLALEVFGNYLKVRIRGMFWWSLGLTLDLVWLRGMERMMYDFYENPEELKKLMAFLRDEALARLDYLEANGLLTLNTGGQYIGSGGLGFTSQLPEGDLQRKIRTEDMWGFAESQETLMISPAMFEEFIFDFQLPILERFGLNCYGCCEPLDNRFEIIRKIPNLRRISVSPWSDSFIMANQLKDEYVFSKKLNPTRIAGKNPDWELIRSEIRDTIEATRGQNLELIMKDTHTISNNPRNITHWCTIARQEIEKFRE